ncbi:sodium:proton antiporter [Candidatus Marinamargulisbacteria bacterium SCGC AG-410-N11]|nr:sodium:proton antiporter [Candidatus Marinamargulisbacteria bacterium SCGC AG-410-N11]
MGLRLNECIKSVQTLLKKSGLIFFVSILCLSFYIGHFVVPTWTVESTSLDIQFDDERNAFYIFKGKPKSIDLISIERSILTQENVKKWTALNQEPTTYEEYTQHLSGDQVSYQKKQVKKHWGYGSLLPAFVAIILCLITREPLTSLGGGIISGAIILGQYNITDTVLIPKLMTKSSAGILILYLWFLGALMGIWSRTGGARAFAEMMTRHVVRGPRTAKLVAWLLGVIFFQGGTISTVLVGTTVKPIADKENISHEELSYIVDSTASPIASQLAFNAWPGYVQAFIFVSGVSFLATESDRIAFFFKSVPFCFYAIFAVLGTFLLSIDKAPFIGSKLKAAIKRSRETGQLNAKGAEPLAAKELEESHVPDGYKPHVIDFFLPLGFLIFVCIYTFIIFGSPQVRWAFGGAVLLAMMLAGIRGMSLHHIMAGVQDGLKGVVYGSCILLFAITIGLLCQELGGGIFLVELLGSSIPFWLLPVLLQLITIVIAFSTGTSWGTYAVAFPLAMPLAWTVAMNSSMAHPEFFMAICFACVMDGSVFGDQCSPLSDTTILSSMCTGCDLMDHVTTQIPQATIAAVLASICWTCCAFLAV